MSTAPTAAPPETPSRYGSASGLRNVDCSAVPLAASPAPTASASRGVTSPVTSGRRLVRLTCAS